MSFSGRAWTPFVGGVVLAALAGCDSSDPEFVLHARTLGLTSEAQREVSKRLREDFGEPKQMVAWQLLPVEFGGHAGTVEGTAAGTTEGRTDVLQVRFDVPPEPEQFERGQQLTFTSGEYEGQSTRALEYSAANGTLTLQDPLETAPQAGDTFVLDFGRTLRDGQTSYMVHCQHCHGTSGDGDGPTAQYLNPRPRDYRLGIFKFDSNLREAPPRRADLDRTIHDGIPGTYMPSFAMMDEEERANIVEYVRWLAMRGQYEQAITGELRAAYSTEEIEKALQLAEASYNRTQEGQRPTAKTVQQELIETVASFPLQELATASMDLAQSVAESWANAEPEASEVRPAEPRRVRPVSEEDVRQDRASEEDLTAYRQSLQRGFDLYQKNCNNCHGPTGRGDGSQTEAFQALPGNPNESYPDPGLYDDWGNKIKPRDLTQGIYRGGRRPVDVYRRIHQGIAGTPMPPFNTKFLNAQGQTDDQQIWDLVNYVMSLPYGSDLNPPPQPAPSDPPPAGADATRDIDEPAPDTGN